MFPQRALKVLLIAIVVFTFASVAYAYAAANVVSASKAGDGNGAISGYTVTVVHYNLNSSAPGAIDSVTFTLDSAPIAGGTIKIKLVAAGSTWYLCTNTTTAVACTTNGASISASDSLRVVVSD